MKIDKKLIKKIDEFDDPYSNSVYAVPLNPKEPRVKVRTLSKRCGKIPKLLDMIMTTIEI